MSKNDVYPVIICGGAGSRLWPSSRPSHPKQFITLTGTKTLFAQTVERVRNIKGLAQLVVVTGSAYARFVEDELAAFDIDAVTILEPEGRDSAPAIAAAVSHVTARDTDGVIVVVASDHHVPDAQAFRDDAERAIEAARTSGIVALGIRPREPSTAYGYIKPGHGANIVKPIDAFVEKPDYDTAIRYIQDGYLWNSGNFIATASTLRTALQDNEPAILTAVDTALRDSPVNARIRVLSAAFLDAPKISFDYAVMERYIDTQGSSLNHRMV